MLEITASKERLIRVLRPSLIKQIVVLLVLFIFCCQRFGYTEPSPGLSGKYKGYNVILIILDALRPDHLSCYGYGKETSPNIDKLAEEGILFTNAFAQASYTLPSVTSIFTSVYPYSHGVRYVSKDSVPDKLFTLAQVLGLYGYETAWFGKLQDPHSGSAPGVLRGFNEKYQEENFSESERRFSWIKSHSQGPFFITIHSYLSHEGTFPFLRFDNKFFYALPDDFLNSFVGIKKKCWDKLQNMVIHSDDKINSVFGQDWIRENKQYLGSPHSDDAFGGVYSLTQNSEQRSLLDAISSDIVYYFFRSFNNKQLLLFKSLFDSAIYEIDKKMVGELVGQLKELGLYEKTLIIITADHGNEFLEHGEFGHGQALYDESIHVPLIYYVPHLKKRVIIKDLVESIDILPTTLDLLSIPVPVQSQGMSLSGLIEGKKGFWSKEYVFSQAAPADTFSIRSDNWKLFLKPAESGSIEKRLFNLNKDPGELRNVIKENPRIAERLKSRLEAWQRSLVVYQAEEREFMPGIGEETKERIRKTGYW